MTWLALAWKYRNDIGIGLIVLVLIVSGLYIKHVFNERDRLEARVTALQGELEAVKKQVTLNGDIANAIQKIRVQSHNYITTVETAPKPDSSKPTVLIPGGLFQPEPVHTPDAAGR